MKLLEASGVDILATLTRTYPDWQDHGLDVIKSREVKGDLILWLMSRRPGYDEQIIPAPLAGLDYAWIWEAFRDDHPGRLYEMYANATWEWCKEDVYDELMVDFKSEEACHGTRH